MRSMETRERILHESLRLFAEKGYDGVSMREIASAVGVKAASLYAHFSGKEAIYQAILQKMDDDYAKVAGQLDIDGSVPQNDVARYAYISGEQLFVIGKQLFEYFLHDDYVRMYRRMLTMGQYQSAEHAKTYSEQYFDDVMSYQTPLFAALEAAGAMDCGGDPEAAALQFYAPIYLLLTLCDRQPEREPEMVRLLEAHIRGFARAHLPQRHKGED